MNPLRYFWLTFCHIHAASLALTKEMSGESPAARVAHGDRSKIQKCWQSEKFHFLFLLKTGFGPPLLWINCGLFPLRGLYLDYCVLFEESTHNKGSKNSLNQSIRKNTRHKTELKTFIFICVNLITSSKCIKIRIKGEAFSTKPAAPLVWFSDQFISSSLFSSV